jgi:hypothetical protein
MSWRIPSAAKKIAGLVTEEAAAWLRLETGTKPASSTNTMVK